MAYEHESHGSGLLSEYSTVISTDKSIKSSDSSHIYEMVDVLHAKAPA